MRFLCDTSVLFAAADAGHEHHGRSLAVAESAAPERSFVAAHSLAELYATLSGTPAPRMRRVEQVLEDVEHAALAFTTVSLDADDYLWVVRHIAAAQGRSGQVHDD